MAKSGRYSTLGKVRIGGKGLFPGTAGGAFTSKDPAIVRLLQALIKSNKMDNKQLLSAVRGVYGKRGQSASGDPFQRLVASRMGTGTSESSIRRVTKGVSRDLEVFGRTIRLIVKSFSRLSGGPIGNRQLGLSQRQTEFGYNKRWPLIRAGQRGVSRGAGGEVMTMPRGSYSVQSQTRGLAKVIQTMTKAGGAKGAFAKMLFGRVGTAAAVLGGIGAVTFGIFKIVGALGKATASGSTLANVFGSLGAGMAGTTRILVTWKMLFGSYAKLIRQAALEMARFSFIALKTLKSVNEQFLGFEAMLASRFGGKTMSPMLQSIATGGMRYGMSPTDSLQVAQYASNTPSIKNAMFNSKTGAVNKKMIDSIMFSMKGIQLTQPDIWARLGMMLPNILAGDPRSFRHGFETGPVEAGISTQNTFRRRVTEEKAYQKDLMAQGDPESLKKLEVSNEYLRKMEEYLHHPVKYGKDPEENMEFLRRYISAEYLDPKQMEKMAKSISAQGMIFKETLKMIGRKIMGSALADERSTKLEGAYGVAAEWFKETFVNPIVDIFQKVDFRKAAKRLQEAMEIVIGVLDKAVRQILGNWSSEKSLLSNIIGVGLNVAGQANKAYKSGTKGAFGLVKKTISEDEDLNKRFGWLIEPITRIEGVLETWFQNLRDDLRSIIQVLKNAYDFWINVYNRVAKITPGLSPIEQDQDKRRAKKAVPLLDRFIRNVVKSGPKYIASFLALAQGKDIGKDRMEDLRKIVIKSGLSKDADSTTAIKTMAYALNPGSGSNPQLGNVFHPGKYRVNGSPNAAVWQQNVKATAQSAVPFLAQASATARKASGNLVAHPDMFVLQGKLAPKTVKPGTAGDQGQTPAQVAAQYGWPQRGEDPAFTKEKKVAASRRMSLSPLQGVGVGMSSLAARAAALSGLSSMSAMQVYGGRGSITHKFEDAQIVLIDGTPTKKKLKLRPKSRTWNRGHKKSNKKSTKQEYYQPTATDYANVYASEWAAEEKSRDDLWNSRYKDSTAEAVW